MAAGDGGLDSAREMNERALGGAVEVEGEVNRLGVRAIEAERRGGGRSGERRRAPLVLGLGLTRTKGIEMDRDGAGSG